MFNKPPNPTPNVFQQQPQMPNVGNVASNPLGMRDQQMAQHQNLFGAVNQMPPQQQQFVMSNAMSAQMANLQQQQQPAQSMFGVAPSNIFAPPAYPPRFQMFGAPSSSVFGGHHSSQSEPTYPTSDRIYDEPIEPAKTPAKFTKSCDISIELKSCLNPVTLGKVRRLPGVCSLKSLGGERTNVDLACVIDISGSMCGEKIELVKKTLLYLLELLNENDRLTLITFDNYAHKLCHLVRASEKNKLELVRIIKKITAGGGNQISEGLREALDTFANRKYFNSVTSIFLLSDGVDYTLPQCKALISQRDIGVYTIHSYGFGADHDSNFLTEVSSRKDGNFYYIIKLDTIDEAFVNALGALFSVVAEKVRVRVKEVGSGLFENVRIAKTYGKMWSKIEKGYDIDLSQMISEVSKDFVFELDIPVQQAELKDTERTQLILTAEFEAITPTKQVLSGSASLKLTFINSSEASTVQVAQDSTALANYLRTKTAECIENSMRLADQRQYSDARGGLEAMMKEVSQYPNCDPSLTKPIVESLQKTIGACTEQTYSQAGQGLFNNYQHSLMNQNNAMYSNQQQMTMFSGLQQKKAGY